MTRFLYIADTHWGAGEQGYTVQPKYDQNLPQLLSALEAWIVENGPIDFILHGGDMIHNPARESVRQAVDLFSLSVPVHLCIGNHDLDAEGSIDLWTEFAPNLLGNGSPNFAVEGTDCIVHVIPNQYGPTPYFWTRPGEASFLSEQVEDLKNRLASAPDRTHIILTHCPIYPIGVEQSGLQEPFHGAPEAFTRTVTELAIKHGVTCVLGAHSHINMNKELNGVNYVTVSSLVETPFDFKLFEVGSDTLSMTTHNLVDRVEFAADYNWDKTFAQGRVCDRGFEKPL
jgi:3',5'-cyclic AMP phosphodiesterase CpdA